MPSAQAVNAETTPFYTSFDEVANPAGLINSTSYSDAGATTQNLSGTNFSMGSLTPQVASVTASAENAPNESAAKLVDGDPLTKWFANTKTPKVDLVVAGPQRVTRYVLTTANDAPDRNPKNWTLRGSNDGSTWTVLDTRTGQLWGNEGASSLHTRHSFAVPADKQGDYSRYRIDVSDNNGAAGTQLAGVELIGTGSSTPNVTPWQTAVDDGPWSSRVAKAKVGFSGTKALRYWGFHTADGAARTTNVLYQDLDLQIGSNTELTYKIFPNLDELELAWPATYVAVDLEYTEAGSSTLKRMSLAGLTDSFGFPATARGQGESKRLLARQWNSVRVDLGALAGATVHKVLLSYDNPNGSAASTPTGWVDDIRIGSGRVIDTSADGLTAYVDTRRGSDSTGDYTRGATFPATAVPNGFNFYTPLTEGSSNVDLYKYQGSNTSANKPRLQGLAISHEPSRWINDRNQMQFMPSVTTDGTPNAGLENRQLTYRHENEIARPDYYSVTFDNGIQAEIAPADHAAILRFTFPASANNRGTIFLDKVSHDAGFTLRSDNTGFDGWMQGGAEGTTRMFVHARFNRATVAQGTAAGDRSGAQYVSFDTSDPGNRVVEMRIATSLMSVSQAWHNYELEVVGKSFSQVRAAAQAAWNQRLGVVELQQATDEQKISMYSSLYRLNLYPNAQHENTGSAAEPVWKYASPVNATTGSPTATETNAKINSGRMYVNNGFWDTYRTAWPLYNLLYPDVAKELIDGFVEQYRAGGWIARWSTPGYKDSMTGTSSDASFADAYIAGAIPASLAEEAYAAGLKNATAVSSANIQADGNYAADQVGRKALNQSIFLGYSPASLDQSVSWGLEGIINDYALGKMAAKLAQDPEVAADRRARYADDAKYLLGRAESYVNLFDASVGDPADANTPLGFFQGRKANGDWLLGPGSYDLSNRTSVYNPEDWDSGTETGHHTYTETNGWNFAFHTPHDVDGLAALYGGQAGLIAKLDTFFATPEKADTRRIHETYEARDVRMGQWGASNQISFHIPWIYSGAGKPSRTQALTRDAVQRLYVGSDIGQGYLGDEDNGAMSAWYVFSALGFYPLAIGSGEYVVGSPLHGKAVIKPLGRNGKVTINAANNSVKNVYVQSATLDGAPLQSASLSVEDAFDGADHTLDFTLGEEPSTWGESTLPAERPTPSIDILDARYASVSATGTEASSLTDNTSSTAAQFSAAGGSVTGASKVGPVTVDEYTLTNGAGSAGGDPRDWRLEASNDGANWTTVDQRNGETFPWRTQTRPFTVASPGSYSRYRLVVTQTGGGNLALSEIEFLVVTGGASTSELAIHASGTVDVRTGAAFTGTLATITTNGEAPAVTVDAGNGPQTATVTSNPFGGHVVSANLVFDTPGLHTVTIAASQGGQHKSVTVPVNVYVDNRTATQVASAANVACFSELGVGGSCDGEGYAYDRAKVRSAGVDFGSEQTVQLGGRTFRYTLADVPAGQKDTLTGRGQVIPVQPHPGSERISFLGMANQGQRTVRVWLGYSDNTEQPVDVSFGDWVDKANNPIAGNTQVFNAPGRLKDAGQESPAKNLAVFATDPVILQPGKNLTQIRLEDQGTDIPAGKAHIVAFAFDGSAVSPLSAVPGGQLPAATAGKQVTAHLATASGGRGDYRAYVNWGDGTTLDEVATQDGALSGSHTYVAAGTYQVHVTVTDGELSKVVGGTIVVAAAPTDPGGPGGGGPKPTDPVVVKVSAPVLSKTSQAYDSVAKRRASISATVSGVTTGVVAFRAGGTLLGTAKLVRQGSIYRASLPIPARLPVGTYRGLTATLTSGGKSAQSQSAGVSLRVVKATTKSVKVSGKKFPARTRPKVTIRVATLSNGRPAVGSLRIRVGKKVVKIAKLTAKRKGKIVVKLPKRYSSAIKVKVRFVPTSAKTAQAKWSKLVSLKLR
ncbi:GH92 family glycosyl hydrolase [Rarobacter incanus]|uniref:Putative alpha-1,2-mannosidase n=1 Tax=Rarobacter incanus TaxID=153494 RepID=A0A542SQU0_9MICO|nr:GH92 family glycosyl hydrolase [Rarobacter incanus]TQK76980.1 putative alpha-1,2-mannosidase [Rarobacter incanus]